MFNIYINDIRNSINKLNIILHADDSCRYYSNSNINDLIGVVNDKLYLVNSWFISNKLTLNVSKSHYIIFSRGLNVPQNIQPIQINYNHIEKVNETKFLGIILQNNMKWDKHIHILSNKISKYSSIIFQIRDKLDNHSLKLIYYALIYSNLIYMNIIWGRSPQQHLKPLIIAQKRTIRSIKFRSKYHHTNDDFYSLAFLKVEEINSYCSSVFTYKSLNSLTYPTDYFTFVGNPNNYPLRNSINLRTPQFRSAQSQTSPSYYGCLIWNSLPPYIRVKPSAASFKSAIKERLLQSYLDKN